MSRNYEILRKAAEESRVVAREVCLAPAPAERTVHESEEPYAKEEARKLVQGVFPLPGMPGPRVVVFAGVGEDGGGAVCALAAQALAARAVGKVCAVDSNFRSPSLHQRFGVDNLEGLADGVIQVGPLRGLARRVSTDNLWLLPCGSRSLNGGTPAAVDWLGGRLHELREEFDYVLIHAAAADKYSDAAALAGLSDGLILVVEADATSREAVERTKQSLEDANVVLLGAVLNNRTFPIPQAIYSRLG
jgi:Mrp family chromosome partitioning ATPase